MKNERIRYFHIGRAGSPAARNFGVGKAKGEIIISCDDDIVAPSSWITAHARNYQDPEVGAVAGRVISENERSTDEIKEVGTVDWCTGNLVNNFDANFRAYVDHGYGCNMSFRKRVLMEANGFDVVFRALGHFEEVDLSLRIRRLGYKIVFEPKAMVKHLQPDTGGNRTRNMDEYMFWKFHNYILLFWKNLDRRCLVVFLISRLLDTLRWAKFYGRPTLVFVGIRALFAGLIDLLGVRTEQARW